MKGAHLVLRNREAFLQLCAVFLTNVGNGMQILASGAMLYKETGTAAAFGFLFVFEYATSFLFQISAGPITDRGHAKFSAFFAELLRGIFIIVALVPMMGGNTWFIFLISLFTNLMKPFYRTGSFAMAPLILPKEYLLTFSSLSSMMLQCGVFLGAAITGFLLVKLSPITIIGLNACSYILSATFIGLSDVPGQTIRDGFKDGHLATIMRHLVSWDVYRDEILGILSDLRKSPSALAPAILCAMDFVAMTFINVLFLPLIKKFGLENQWISYWDAAFAIGAIFGAFLAIPHASKKLAATRLWPALLLQALLFAAAPGMLGLGSYSPAVFVIWMLALGLANGYSVPVFVFAAQVCLPGLRLGRISSIRQFSIATLSAFAVPLLAQLVDRESGIITAFFIIAAASALFSMGALMVGRRYGGAI